jgi:gliding motility-associated-like protein
MVSLKTPILSPMKSWLALLSFSLGTGVAIAQSAPGSIIVSTGTPIATSNSTQIAFTGGLTVNSDNADLSKATLILAGANQDLRMTRGGSLLVLGGLIVGPSGGGTGGTKNLFNGTWEIAGTLIFNDGVVVPQTGSNGKLVHSIAAGTAADVVVNNPDSYFNGTFYSRGTGIRVFPIGNGSGYFPSMLTSVSQDDVEIGMRVINQNVNLTHGSEILNVFEDQYWEIVNAQALAGPKVILSTLGAGFYLDPNIGTIILGGAGVGQPGVPLGGFRDGDYLVGDKAITTNERFFTMAKVGPESNLLKVKIRNVVTPFVDGVNDHLFIKNIEIYPDNKVTMLDRWGTLVREWTGFINADANTANSTYDLSKIATGNYIVILEYTDGSTRKQESQMVTIINQ